MLSALGKGAIVTAICRTASIARVLPGSIFAAIWRRSTRRCAPHGSRWMPTTGRSSCALQLLPDAQSARHADQERQQDRGGAGEPTPARLRWPGGYQQGEDGFTLRCHETRVHAQYLFNCTTPSYQLPPNRLSHQLLQDGLVQENLFGGVKCNPHTLKIADRAAASSISTRSARPPRATCFTPRRWNPSRGISARSYSTTLFSTQRRLKYEKRSALCRQRHFPGWCAVI